MDFAITILKVGAVMSCAILVGIPTICAVAACMLSSKLSREEEQTLEELDANERDRMSLEG